MGNEDVEKLIENLSADRLEAVKKLREVINMNLPDGFEEGISYGMLAWVVPHSVFPSGYHCDPKQPLPFISLALQKNFIALYHMGIYAFPELLDWFQNEWPKHSKRKLDMGKSCIRFKKVEDIPYYLIGNLVSKIPMQDWIDHYTTVIQK